MSRNGSGTYTLPAGNPIVTGTTISSTWANNTLTDIATALTGSLSADGQTTATGALQYNKYAAIMPLANRTCPINRGQSAAGVYIPRRFSRVNKIAQFT